MQANMLAAGHSAVNCKRRSENRARQNRAVPTDVGTLGSGRCSVMAYPD